MQRQLITIIIALVLAIGAGIWAGTGASFAGVPLHELFGLIGTLFLNALQLIVVPLVISSIIVGSQKLGEEKGFGALSRRTFGFYLLTSASAVLVALIAFQFFSFQPLESASEIASIEETTLFSKIASLLTIIIPSNLFAVAAKGQVLGVLLFSMAFGYFISTLKGIAKQTLIHFWEGVFTVLMKMTRLVMLALPIGVFGLVAEAVAKTGINALAALGLFSLLVVLSLAIYIFVVLPLFLYFVAHIPPKRHFQAMWPALITAFTTSSSAATLPVLMECLEDRAGVPNRICSFTAPLGASMNLSGTALYITLAALFISSGYGQPLPFSTQCLIAFVSLISSFGIAGIPSASLVAIVVVLQVLGLPQEGIVILLAAERFLDMARTLANAFSNSCCTVLVARTLPTSFEG